METPINLKLRYLIAPVGAVAIIFLLYQILGIMNFLHLSGKNNITTEKEIQGEHVTSSKDNQGKTNTCTTPEITHKISRKKKAFNKSSGKSKNQNSMMLKQVVYNNQIPIQIFDDGKGHTRLVREGEIIFDFTAKQKVPRSELADQYGYLSGNKKTGIPKKPQPTNPLTEKEYQCLPKKIEVSSLETLNIKQKDIIPELEKQMPTLLNSVNK